MARAEQLQKENKKRKQNEDVKFPSQEEMGMSDNEYMRFQHEQGVYKDESGTLKQLTPEDNIDRRRVFEGEDIPSQTDMYQGSDFKPKPISDPLTSAKRKAQADIAPQFSDVFWMRSVSTNIDFKNLNKLTKKKESV